MDSALRWGSQSCSLGCARGLLPFGAHGTAPLCIAYWVGQSWCFCHPSGGQTQAFVQGLVQAAQQTARCSPGVVRLAGAACPSPAGGCHASWALCRICIDTSQRLGMGGEKQVARDDSCSPRARGGWPGVLRAASPSPQHGEKGCGWP